MLKISKKPSNQNGAALVTAIFSILIATVIGIALYYSVLISLRIAVNDRDNTEAFYLADAGINHAAALIGKVPKSKATRILTAGANTAPGSGDELSVPPSFGLWEPVESIPAGDATGGGILNFGAGGTGRYWVTVKNDSAFGETPTTDSNGVLIVTSTGVGRDGATATIETTTTMNPFPAILINSKAKVSGNLSVKGTGGILHANNTLNLLGNPCSDMYFSSSANIINPSNLSGAGCLGMGFNRAYQKIIKPPIYDIRADFYDKADYILGAIGSQAGKVYDNAGTLIHDTSSARNRWRNGSSTWTWDDDDMTWSHSGSSILNATFYSEGNIEIGGNFGTESIPVRVTFIAEGYITNSGKQYLSPEYLNFSLVAGTDLHVRGRLSEGTELSVQGINYAKHQISFSGTPNIYGMVIAANQDDTDSPGCECNLVPLDDGYMSISGNPNVTYDGDYIGGGTSINNWREVRY